MFTCTVSSYIEQYECLWKLYDITRYFEMSIESDVALWSNIHMCIYVYHHVCMYIYILISLNIYTDTLCALNDKFCLKTKSYYNLPISIFDTMS